MQKSILFSPLMVEAIRARRKTMTRRLDTDIKAGDAIYVKETHYLYGQWVTNGTTKKGKQKWRFVVDNDSPVKYNDNPPETYCISRSKEIGAKLWYKRNSLFMEKRHTRIWLHCITVKKERIQQINTEDCIKEGIEPNGVTGGGGVMGYKNYGSGNENLLPYYSFRSLWIKIHGIKSWYDNPEVSVITFTVQSIDPLPF